MMIILLTRFIQTSIASANRTRDPEAQGEGYLFEYKGKTPDTAGGTKDAVEGSKMDARRKTSRASNISVASKVSARSNTSAITKVIVASNASKTRNVNGASNNQPYFSSRVRGARNMVTSAPGTTTAGNTSATRTGSNVSSARNVSSAVISNRSDTPSQSNVTNRTGYTTATPSYISDQSYSMLNHAIPLPPPPALLPPKSPNIYSQIPDRDGNRYTNIVRAPPPENMYEEIPASAVVLVRGSAQSVRAFPPENIYEEIPASAVVLVRGSAQSVSAGPVYANVGPLRGSAQSVSASPVYANVVPLRGSAQSVSASPVYANVVPLPPKRFNNLQNNGYTVLNTVEVRQPAPMKYTELHMSRSEPTNPAMISVSSIFPPAHLSISSPQHVSMMSDLNPPVNLSRRSLPRLSRDKGGAGLSAGTVFSQVSTASELSIVPSGQVVGLPEPQRIVNNPILGPTTPAFAMRKPRPWKRRAPIPDVRRALTEEEARVQAEAYTNAPRPKSPRFLDLPTAKKMKRKKKRSSSKRRSPSRRIRKTQE